LALKTTVLVFQINEIKRFQTTGCDLIICKGRHWGINNIQFKKIEGLNVSHHHKGG